MSEGCSTCKNTKEKLGWDVAYVLLFCSYDKPCSELLFYNLLSLIIFFIQVETEVEQVDILV